MIPSPFLSLVIKQQLEIKTKEKDKRYFRTGLYKSALIAARHPQLRSAPIDDGAAIDIKGFTGPSGLAINPSSYPLINIKPK